jgi:hypothetical protein
MSVEISVRAYKTKLGNSVAKSILVMLGDSANDSGYCWPSAQYIADRTEVAVRTVRRVVEAFSEMGLVSRLTVEGKLYKKAFQINLDMLGNDCSEAYAIQYQRLHEKAVPGTEAEETVPDDTFSVPGDRKTVPDDTPPHPLIGVTVRNRKNRHKLLPVKQNVKVTKENILTFPPWVDAPTQTAWGDFLGVRKRMRKPMTPEAERRMWAKLEKLYHAGQDIAAVLDQSIRAGWTDVYEVKEDWRSNGKGAANKIASNVDVLRRSLGEGEGDQGSSGRDGFVSGSAGDSRISQSHVGALGAGRVARHPRIPSQVERDAAQGRPGRTA